MGKLRKLLGASKRMSITKEDRIERTTCLRCGKLTANLSRECRYCLGVQSKFVEVSRKMKGGRS